MKVVVRVTCFFVDLAATLFCFTALFGQFLLTTGSPQASPDGFIVEGHLPQESIIKAGRLVKDYPEVPVYVTGTSRSSLTFKSKEPGVLRWEIPAIPQIQGVTCEMRFHSMTCAGINSGWQIRLNDSIIFEASPNSYDSKQISFPLDIDESSCIEVYMIHPTPNEDCYWDIWYIWLNGIEYAIGTSIVFVPTSEDQEEIILPATLGEIGFETLVENGIKSSRIKVVTPTNVSWSRTFSGALDLRTFLAANRLKENRLNLISEGFHARRSLEGFRKALAPQKHKVGLTYLENNSPDKWWQSDSLKKEFWKQSAQYWIWKIRN